jgi:hypothetical protein
MENGDDFKEISVQEDIKFTITHTLSPMTQILSNKTQASLPRNSNESGFYLLVCLTSKRDERRLRSTRIHNRDDRTDKMGN